MSREYKAAAILGDNSPFDLTEAFVRLRTNFIYITLNGTYKKIVFTSCEQDEGKSTTVLNLAIALAKSEKRVLLLDCDMRRSAMRLYMRHKGTAPGLSAILSNLEDYRNCIGHNEKYGFDTIFSGDAVPNPSELLGSDNMRRLLAVLEEQYDYILLDAPPVLSVSDPAILSTMADGVVFVVRHGKIKKKQLSFAVQSLRTVGAKILGTVLDMYDVKKDHSAYGYSGNYYYKYYYGNSYGSKEKK